MRTLARDARGKRAPVAEPLPWNFPQLDRVGVTPRYGTVTMIAATPNAGKTFIAAKYVQKVKQPTLFFSADTDRDTMLVRCAAIASGVRQTEVRAALADDEGGADYWADVLAEEYKDVRWVWESDPTYEDLALETMAFAEAYGMFPRVIVVDNIANIVGQNENEWASLRDHTKALHRLVRITGAAVIVLHHMSENKADPSYPAPSRDIQGKISQFPEMILSLAASDDGGLMRICALKNRWGPKDPSGAAYIEIPVDLDTGSFYASAGMKNAGLPL